MLSGNYNGQSGDDVVLKGKVMIGQISFEVLEGDVTKETSDCIVNGTNEYLDLRQGNGLCLFFADSDIGVFKTAVHVLLSPVLLRS